MVYVLKMPDNILTNNGATIRQYQDRKAALNAVTYAVFGTGTYVILDEKSEVYKVTNQILVEKENFG
jgi:hypothetical protein